MKKLYIDTLPASTSKLISLIQNKNPKFLKLFYLSGGTALSLQIGHRQSEDLDFFSKRPFNPLKIQQELELVGQLKSTQLEKGTLNTFLNSVRLQFLEYQYPLLEKTVEWQNIQLSSVADIACTKLQTIGMRGFKKDFIDLFFILQTYPLKTLFNKMKVKYKKSNYSTVHILKSLLYFKDAEKQPMPRMAKKVGWSQVKSEILKKVKDFSF